MVLNRRSNGAGRGLVVGKAPNINRGRDEGTQRLYEVCFADEPFDDGL